MNKRLVIPFRQPASRTRMTIGVSDLQSEIAWSISEGDIGSGG